uniref:ATP synthase F0 subunit 8 n=1 Tax=Pseudunio homsensis TaxID=1985456 RepID=UPI002551F894|nr:ATP synthase F0 subunit 8 [Margaritifera homsensis]WGM81363.1 ATP synthase F0 subunit 8 [Margaritifera homsensis]
MPQLSPMSWVFVFGVFLVFFIWLSITVWWSNSGGYKAHGSMAGSSLNGACAGLKWGFAGKPLGEFSSKN